MRAPDSRSRGTTSRPVVALLAGLLLALLAPSPATAASQGQIEQVTPGDGRVRILYSMPGIASDVSPDLRSLQVTFEERPLPATATLASDAGDAVQRTTVLAIDVSASMRGDRFRAAIQAARTFLETAPADVPVGIVTFAATVEVVQRPTLDRTAAIAALNTLTLSLQTRLYEGVAQAVTTAGTRGQRSILVLSDGKDTTDTALADLTGRIEKSGVRVDVVTLDQRGNAATLQQMANAGGGRVLAADPKELAGVFAGEAQTLAKQVLVDAKVPADLSRTQGTLSVSLNAGADTYADSAWVKVAQTDAPTPTTSRQLPTALPTVPEPRFVVPRAWMLAGLAAATLGGSVMLLSAFGVLTRPKRETLEDRIAAYSRTRDPRAAAGTPGAILVGPRPTMGGQAVNLAQKALASNQGLESRLAARLEAAGMRLKPAEWLLIHTGIAFGAGLVGVLLGSGRILLTLILLVAGLLLPWTYLGFQRSRRLKAFNSQLADTLQLMAGSLSAGLSLAQSVDTVVREGTEPMAGEFRRALVEARLGVDIEDGLESVAGRMSSEDFRWVVMAIRIQREVGGNLAELLLTVAATLREREYLRRQVSALSAEGRLSAWILGGLPPVFVLYLALAQPAYLAPMLDNVLGWVMAGLAATMMVVGVIWLRKVVKVEV